MTNLESLAVMLVAELETCLLSGDRISSNVIILCNDIKKLLDSNREMYETDLAHMYKINPKLFLETKLTND